ncbi:acyl-CoA dehydrogenase family protein [Streptomyces sp. NPDC006997]|uniref:acyl-CoA dehydrogenase family protein n=1 Tax=Streptomyces sp. NPDC006997 TaxID=3155356 RepID=UPI0033EF2197
MSETITACEAAAYDAGPARGLALALATADPGPPPGGVGALPSRDVPPDAEVVPHRLAALEGVSFVRLSTPGPAAAAARPWALAAHLAAVRAGVVRRLVDDAVTHLARRSAGGELLSQKQLVRGVVADTHTELEAVLRLVRVAGHLPAAVVDAHDRLTALDWEAAKLLGAAGFLADGPARAGYVAWLVGESWLDRNHVTAKESAPC